MGEEQARSFRMLIDSLPALRVLGAPREHHGDVVRMLERFRGSKLSYVDAASLAFLERHKIACVWSTDRHLGLTGAAVLPRT